MQIFRVRNNKFIIAFILNYDKIALLCCFLIYILVNINNSDLSFYSIMYKLWKSTTKFSSFVKNWSFENTSTCNILKQFCIFRNCQAILTCHQEVVPEFSSIIHHIMLNQYSYLSRPRNIIQINLLTIDFGKLFSVV